MQRLLTLSRTFITVSICLTKNKIWDFHSRRIYPILLHPNTRNLLLLLFYTTASLDFGRCPISELTTHSPRMVNNSTMHPRLTRRDVTMHMKCNHFISCYVMSYICTIRATCNIYKSRIIIFPTYNFHLSQFSCYYVKQVYINMIFTHNIMSSIFPTITHKIAQISDSYKTWHLLVPSRFVIELL